MCLIIDEDVIHCFYEKNHQEYELVKEALLSGHVKAVYGGELKRKYLASDDIRDFLLRLDQSGAARIVSDQAVDVQATNIRASALCRSNDYYVLALAIISGARLLCSHDKLLGQDFKNPSIISNPRGRVHRRKAYQRRNIQTMLHYAKHNCKVCR